MVFYKDENKIYMIDIDNELILKELPKDIYKVNYDKSIKFEKMKLDNLSELDGDEYKRIKEKVIKNKANSIFIGKSGFGKSLLVKHIINELKNDYYVFIIEKIDPNIIKELALKFEKCIFVFDEFEKNYMFRKSEEYYDNEYKQEEFLSLLDGLYQNNNHIFLFTANDIKRINPYLLNRPGRIRYRFIFKKIDVSIIKKYFGENILLLKLNNYGLLSMDIINYIKEEIKKGYSIEESLYDLGFSKELVLLIDKKNLKYNPSYVKEVLNFKFYFNNPNEFQIYIEYIDIDNIKNDDTINSYEIIDMQHIGDKIIIKTTSGDVLEFFN